MPRTRISRLEVADVNRAIQTLSDELDSLDEKLEQLRAGSIAFTGDVDFGGFRGTNVATAESDDDFLSLAELNDRLIDIEEDDIAFETNEAEGSGGSAKGRRSARRTSRLKDFAEEAAETAVEGAVPTVAPPEIETASALGTTSDPAIFALSDHTHAGMNLTDAQTAANTKTFSGTLSVTGTTQVTETGGPTLLTLGPVADGDLLSRSGTNIVGTAAGGFSSKPHNFLDSAEHSNTVTQLPTQGSIIKGNATPAWDELVLGAANLPLHVNAGGTDLEYSTLVVAGGGTGATSFTQGSVIFMGASALTEDNANLFWDDTANELGIRTNDPRTIFHVLGPEGEAEGVVTGGSPTLAIFQNARVDGGGSVVVHLISGTVSGSEIAFGDKDDLDSGRVSYNNNDDSLGFYTDGTRRVAINQDGNTQIGATASVPTASPDSPRLHVLDRTGTTTFPSLAGEDGQCILMQNDVLVGDHCRMFFASGTSGTDSILFGDSDAVRRGLIEYDNSSDEMTLGTAGSAHITIDSTGQVGIATSPSAGLHYLGDEVRLERNSTSSTFVDFYDSGGLVGRVSADNGGFFDLRVAAGANLGFRIENSSENCVIPKFLKVDGAGGATVGTVPLSVGATEQLQVASDGDLQVIKSVSYDWPAANAAGVLLNDGAGNLSWTVAGTGVDHGGLAGLADDDHTQYILADGTRAFSAYIDIDEAVAPGTPAANVMRIYAEDFHGFPFLTFQDDGGVVRRFVRDSVFVGYNNRGTTIAAGRIVYATGAFGDVPTLDTARADAGATMPAIGVTIESIANNAHGRVMQVGLLENVNTAAFSAGDVLYVSAVTAGVPTATAPLWPNLRQEIGTILVSDAAIGSIQLVARTVQNDSVIDHGGLLGLADDDHAQYLLADGTRALTAAWDAGAFEIRAETFESDVTTGTAPFTIASTTVVPNLNVDQVDGRDETEFALLVGRAGGQILRGGTAAGDDLDLRASSASDYTGMVLIGKGAGDYGTTTAVCADLWPDGITFGFAADIIALRLSSTLTQDINASFGLPNVALLSATYTHTIASGVVTPSVDFVFDSEPTITNPLATAASGGGYFGTISRPVFSSTGGSTLTTAANLAVGFLSAYDIGSSVTATTYTHYTVGSAAYGALTTTLSGTLTTETVLDCGTLRGTTQLTVVSDNADAEMRHRGPAVFGENAAVGTNEIVRIIQSSTSGAIPALLLDQADVDEPFFKVVGDAAAANLTRNIVDEGDVTTATRQGWIKVEVQDDGNQITDQDYYIPLYTLA